MCCGDHTIGAEGTIDKRDSTRRLYTYNRPGKLPSVRGQIPGWLQGLRVLRARTGHHPDVSFLLIGSPQIPLRRKQSQTHLLSCSGYFLVPPFPRCILPPAWFLNSTLLIHQQVLLCNTLMLMIFSSLFTKGPFEAMNDSQKTMPLCYRSQMNPKTCRLCLSSLGPQFD